MDLDLISEVLRVAGELGLGGWERLVLIIVAALLVVLGRKGWQAIKKVEVKVTPPSGPVDEGGPLPPGQSFPSHPENDGQGSLGG